MNILSEKLLILASAGSGKTFQLSNRIIGLIASGKPPAEIVALTFTRKAAGEFADAVLSKLAKAATDPAFAAELAAATGVNAADFPQHLATTVANLPKLTLGTMDSFFSRIVRNFQYELGITGGPFDLLEGPRAEAAREEIIAGILASTLDDATTTEFIHAFRRSTIGREHVRVTDNLREFIKEWHGRFRSNQHLDWGPPGFATAPIDAWEKQKSTLAAKVRAGLDTITYHRKGHREAFEKAVDTLESHTIGSGSIGSSGVLVTSIFECAATPGAPMTPQYFKPFLVPGPAGEALREMALLIAHCEMSAALARTRAIRDVLSIYDRRCESQLRQNGLLGFDDIKFLMAAWVRSEEARVLREAVDFRLDTRFNHWLLDEFQDTSGEQWNGLQPLLDEAGIYNPETSTIFIVGDRKQAIYGWRGGKVTIFDDVIERYGPSFGNKPKLEIEPMAESWRSSPEILNLVNRIGGDNETLAGLFGETAARWEWEEHVSATPLTHPSRSGHARVEILEDEELRLDRLEEILRELGVGEKQMSCGILVRSNARVRQIADFLRPLGFDVIEEGERDPSKDNLVGITLHHLLKWLADPSDRFSERLLFMSPLGPVIRERYGEHWQRAWEELLGEASNHGFAAMASDLIQPLLPSWSDFGQRRAHDVITALRKFDSQGGTTPHEAALWIGRLRISQSPGVAAVQVMTIHKSKGLGFDAVILPEVPDDNIPDLGDFKAAIGDTWISSPPPAWARAVFPQFADAENRWTGEQRYEAMCLLYVAITRPKRGLYILLAPTPPSRKKKFSSLTSWIAGSLQSSGEPGIIYESGSAGWHRSLPLLEKAPQTRHPVQLGPSVPRRNRSTPSGTKDKSTFTGLGSTAGMKHGNEIHQALEQIAWIDQQPISDPRIASFINAEPFHPIFRRNGRNITLLREQPVEAILDGSWISGTIDRLHLHRDASGDIIEIEIIDFKTDAIHSIDELTARYTGQMQAYHRIMTLAYPDVPVTCTLLSTRLRQSIKLHL